MARAEPRATQRLNCRVAAKIITSRYNQDRCRGGSPRLGRRTGRSLVEHFISNLLKRYEGGALSRRDLVKGLAMLTAAGGTASAAGFESSTLNHVSILVSDVPRSAAFYQRVFNLSVLDEDKAAPRIRLRLGKSSHL